MTRGCEERNADGSPCGMAPMQAERWCFNHHPEKKAERAAARERGGKHRKRVRVVALPASEPVRLRSAGDVQDALERTVTEVLQLDPSPAKYRVLSNLYNLALRGIEVGEMENRLAALEQQLRGLQPEPKIRVEK